MFLAGCRRLHVCIYLCVLLPVLCFTVPLNQPHVPSVRRAVITKSADLHNTHVASQLWICEGCSILGVATRQAEPSILEAALVCAQNSANQRQASQQ